MLTERAWLRGRVRREELPKVLLFVIAVGLVGAALFAGLDASASRAFAGNSDGATVVLEGLAIRHGHLLLGGWDLSFDSFWGIDAVVYAVASAVIGFHANLLAVGPALIAIGLIAIGVAVASRGRRTPVAILASLVVISVLGMPSPVLAFFLLQGPWHVGTALWCLIAFVGLRRRRFDAGWIVAVVFLTAALLSDLSTIAIGLLPCVAAGLVTMARYRSPRSGTSTLAAPFVTVGLAFGLRELFVRVGTFAIAQGVTKAKAARYPANLQLVIRWGAGLLGIGKVPVGPTSSLGPYELLPTGALEHGFRAFVLAIVTAALVVAAASLVVGIVRAKSLFDVEPSRSLLHDLLFFGAVGAAGLFVALCPNGNGDYARYVTPAVVFAAVLAASTTGHLLARLSDTRALNVVLVISLILAAVGGVGYRSELSRAPAPQAAVALGRLLEAHHLSSGIGDYWSSSIVTVVTGGKVAVRPVIPNRDAVLVRYGRQSDASWYKGVRFTFLVYDLDRPWRNVNSTTGERTLGRPSEHLSVGSYVILVWSQGFAVSSIGYTRG